MLPSLWPTDVVRVESIARAKVCAGDIGLFKRGDRLTIHRIVDKASVQDNKFWISKGDSMPGCDPPFSEKALLGKVCCNRALRPRANSAAKYFIRGPRNWMAPVQPRGLAEYGATTPRNEKPCAMDHAGIRSRYSQVLSYR